MWSSEPVRRPPGACCSAPALVLGACSFRPLLHASRRRGRARRAGGDRDHRPRRPPGLSGAQRAARRAQPDRRRGAAALHPRRSICSAARSALGIQLDNTITRYNLDADRALPAARCRERRRALPVRRAAHRELQCEPRALRRRSPPSSTPSAAPRARSATTSAPCWRCTSPASRRRRDGPGMKLARSRRRAGRALPAPAGPGACRWCWCTAPTRASCASASCGWSRAVLDDPKDPFRPYRARRRRGARASPRCCSTRRARCVLVGGRRVVRRAPGGRPG